MRLLWIGVAVLALALRTAEVARRSLQVDEGLTLYLGGLPVRDALAYLRIDDVHPPLLTLVVHLLESAHAPDVLIRALAVFIGAASVVLAMAIVRCWAGDRTALIAGFFAACMPLLIFNDSMIRMYGFFDFFALAAIFMLSLLLTKQDLAVRARRWLWVCWTITTVAALYTLYAAFFVLAAQLLYAIVIRRDAVWRLIGGTAVALAAWLPQAPTFAQQLPSGGIAFPGFAGHVGVAIATLPEQATLQIPYEGPIGIALVAFVWLWLVATLWATIRAQPRSLLPWMAAPAILTLLFSLATHRLLYEDRYYTIFAFGLCMWTAIASGAWIMWWDRRTAIAGPASAGSASAGPTTTSLKSAVVIAACAVMLAIAAQHVTDPRHATADWGAVGKLLTSASRPNDCFVFEQGSPVYVLGRAGVLGHHPIALVFRRSQIDAVAHEVAPYDRVWYIGFQAWPVDRNDRVLANLQRDYRLTQAWRFERALASEAVVVAQFERNSPPRLNHR